jgi:predicted transglutaminase-like cysteine proteinase
MSGNLGRAIVALAAFALTLSLASPCAQATEVAATYASIGPDTSVPFGWVDFCLRYRGECTDAYHAPATIDLTPEAMKKIQQINAYVNKSIEPVTDMEHWGVVDQWDYPTDGKGDCEDFALMKRRMLIASGFPRQALLMTVVKERNGDGHAILTVKTSRGEFVLDNLSDAVKPWNATSYRFVKRQSQENENVWVAIGAPTSAPAYVSK